MANFKFWDFKQRLDDYYFEVVNITMKAIFLTKRLTGKYEYMKRNIELKNIHKGKKGFLIANGPSINKQNLKLLKNEITFFVNRSFLHKDYKYIKPTFHVIVDSKLATGEWNIDFLDKIIEVNPEVIFLLNAKWHYLDKFQPYIEDDRFKIYWVDTNLFTTPFYRYRKIDLTRLTYGSAVSGAATTSMIYMGIKDIYFLGQDGNGLCYEIIDRDSHFYGSNPENKRKKMKDIYSDLYMMSLTLKNWTYFNNYCKEIGVNIYNCTEGGIFNMLDRKKYEEVVSDK